jgi:predicted HTH domain antitoxin
MKLTLSLPDDPAWQGLTPEEAQLDLTCSMYARGAVSKLRGAELAGVDFFAFQTALAERHISSSSDDMIMEDLKTIGSLSMP